MKNKLMIIAIIAVIGFTMIACNKSGGSSIGGGGKSLNSPEALKEYLDSQPANRSDKPIKVSMGANELMIPKIRDVLKSLGKYVSLNLTGNALTTIPYYAFQDCKLVSITIPNSVTSIGEWAFYDCESLTSVTIPDSVTIIGRRAFSGCESLASVTIPNSVISIGNEAFDSCTSLTSVSIGNGVTSIGDNAFDHCESLTSITIPKSVTNIGGGAFNGCNSLTAIEVNAANTEYSSIDGVLYNKGKTTLIIYPSRKAGVFTIPNGVTSIENSAFSSCTSLTSVTIPDSVTSIGYDNFVGCTGLTSVTFQGMINPQMFTDYWDYFDGDLITKYLAEGIGTYTRSSGSDTWKKQ